MTNDDQLPDLESLVRDNRTCEAILNVEKALYALSDSMSKLKYWVAYDFEIDTIDYRMPKDLSDLLMEKYLNWRQRS